jgi:hypothetical protein
MLGAKAGKASSGRLLRTAEQELATRGHGARAAAGAQYAAQEQRFDAPKHQEGGYIQ